MKKEVRPFVFTLIVLVILIAAYPSYLLFSKVSTDLRIESRLEENDYEKDISKQETKFDLTTGRYFVEIKYKNEPDYTYYYTVINGVILTSAYNQKNVQVTAGLKHGLK